MAMGTKQAREKQEELFYASERTETPGHPFYEQLNRVLDRAGFDAFCEAIPPGGHLSGGNGVDAAPTGPGISWRPAAIDRRDSAYAPFGLQAMQSISTFISGTAKRQATVVRAGFA